MATQVSKNELAETMIALASQYRQMADRLSIDAYKQLTAGTIDKATYDRFHENADKIFAQAVAIHREVAALADGLIEADLAGIESARKALEDATARIAKTREIINITLAAITAIGAILIACSTPNPETILAAVQSTKALADDIAQKNA